MVGQTLRTGGNITQGDRPGGGSVESDVQGDVRMDHPATGATPKDASREFSCKVGFPAPMIDEYIADSGEDVGLAIECGMHAAKNVCAAQEAGQVLVAKPNLQASYSKVCSCLHDFACPGYYDLLKLTIMYDSGPRTWYNW
jgi:hypothetical protein